MDGAAVGGLLGGLYGLSADVVFDDSRLDDFAADLDRDTLALADGRISALTIIINGKDRG